ncbi:hypothetical protein K1719_020593 [Acacia pycnantha]|nr:hypothetical protein K1719_020593 [Acacia pycnantha]
MLRGRERIRILVPQRASLLPLGQETVDSIVVHTKQRAGSNQYPFVPYHNFNFNNVYDVVATIKDKTTHIPHTEVSVSNELEKNLYVSKFIKLTNLKSCLNGQYTVTTTGKVPIQPIFPNPLWSSHQLLPRYDLLLNIQTNRGGA